MKRTISNIFAIRNVLTFIAILFAFSFGCVPQAETVKPKYTPTWNSRTGSETRFKKAQIPKSVYTPRFMVKIIKVYNLNGKGIRLRFYNHTRNYHRGWGNYYIPSYRLYRIFRLRCVEGHKICLGAWRGSRYWGCGKRCRKYCSNCCFRCNHHQKYFRLR